MKRNRNMTPTSNSVLSGKTVQFRITKCGKRVQFTIVKLGRLVSTLCKHVWIRCQLLARTRSFQISAITGILLAVLVFEIWRGLVNIASFSDFINYLLPGILADGMWQVIMEVYRERKEKNKKSSDEDE